MESKIVKVIDEHSIDRDANIICCIDVDGSDYVVYWIERDADNDNIFVSKLLKNLDGTSNMINIDDTMEKSKISNIIKELITYSVNNEADKLSTKSVALPSGKNVGISSVLINREQNINVQKTYITTVKKSVTKVSEEFYTVELVEKETENVIQPDTSIFEDINVIAPEVVAPIELPQETPVVPEAEVISQVTPVIPTPSVVLPEPVVVPEVNTVEPILEVKEPEVSVMPVEPVNSLPAEPILPEVEKAPEVEPKVEVLEEPTLIIPTPVISEPEAPVVLEPVIEPVPEVKVADSVIPTPVENKIVFDASKETNLNVALGEVSAETPIAVDNVEPIREFGVDESKVVSEIVEPLKEVDSSSKSSSGNGGFANKKFFIVVALTFFVASCVFLGYEVFQYFQLAK